MPSSGTLWQDRPRLHVVFAEAALSASLLDKNLPSERWFWLIGIVFTLLGTTVAVIGYSLQKLAHERQCLAGREHSLAHEKSPYWTDPRWLVGLVVMLVGQAMSWLVQGFTSQSILAGFNCWNIFVVFGVAPLLFGEQVSEKALAGAGLIVVGMIWMVCSGPRDWEPETIYKLAEHSRYPPFLCMMATSACFVAYKVNYARLNRLNTSAYDHVVIASAFASYGILCSKCASALTVTSMEIGDSQVCHWQFLVLLVAAVFFGVSQLHSLNMAMRLGEAVAVLPIYYAMSMVSQVVLISTFFHEFHTFTFWPLVRFWLGVLVVIAGVAVLSWSRRGSDGDGEKVSLTSNTCGKKADSCPEKRPETSMGRP